MIEISMGKLVLLALVALIVLGPEKLPGAARTAGALLRRVRLGWDSVRAEVERELEIEEIRRAAREAAAQAEAAQAEVKAEMNTAAHDLREPFAQAAGELVTPTPEAAAPVGEAAPGGAAAKESMHGDA
jgi:sec-independent protein translocase protein TatB